MTNPFFARKMRDDPPPEREPVFKDEFGEESAVEMTCRTCSKPVVKDYKDNWIHKADVIHVRRGQVTADYSDHPPLLYIIDTTGKEL
jgi:hypothetical protein